MPFTEFYCDTGGSNLNSGSTTSTTATYEATNGGWDSTTGVFTPLTGDPSASVSVGNFASVYNDSATVGVFVGRVTAVNTTTITVDLTVKSGTAPTTSAVLRSIRVGGAWKGPNAAEDFPFGFANGNMAQSGENPRINFKAQTYNVTAAVAHSLGTNPPVQFEGYTSTPGDGGRATIDGGTTGTAFAVLSISTDNVNLINFTIQNNGNSSTGVGFALSGAEIYARGLVAHDLRGRGFNISGANINIEECEAYNCNQSASANSAGFEFSGTANYMAFRCISHDNSDTNSDGFYVNTTGSVLFMGCIADTNGRSGIRTVAGSGNRLHLINCDLYNNVSDGLTQASNNDMILYYYNSNFIDNGSGGTGWGINDSGTGARNGAMVNCGFGSGTAANASGTYTGMTGIDIKGEVTYATDVTPYNAPTTGDFRITLAAAKDAGRGTFTQTQASYTGTVGYPDIGAAEAIQATANAGPLIGSGRLIRA